MPAIFLIILSRIFLIILSRIAFPAYIGEYSTERTHYFAQI